MFLLENMSNSYSGGEKERLEVVLGYSLTVIALLYLLLVIFRNQNRNGTRKPQTNIYTYALYERDYRERKEKQALTQSKSVTAV